MIIKNEFIEFKYENFVLTLTTFNDTPTDSEWDFTKKTILRFYDSALKNNTKFSIIFNIAKLNILDIKKLKEWIELFKNNREKTKKVIHRTAMITDIVFIKYTLNIFLSIYNTERPSKIVSNMEEAINFISQN
tara:strand:+ start:2733 stop:3131 length:399 start_codon:yes stop_codon:yes gene_type:complete